MCVLCGEFLLALVQDFSDWTGVFIFPVFDSAGVFAGSSAGFPPSTASILATQIPEPSTGLLLALGLSALALARRSVA